MSVWIGVREQWIVQYFECINKIFTIFIYFWVMMTLVIIINSWELCSHQWVNVYIYWSVLWSAGFFVFMLKWKMDGVLIDGECVWLMEYVFWKWIVYVYGIFFLLFLQLWLYLLSAWYSSLNLIGYYLLLYYAYSG